MFALQLGWNSALLPVSAAGRGRACDNACKAFIRKNEQDADDICIASIFPVHPAGDSDFLNGSETGTVIYAEVKDYLYHLLKLFSPKCFILTLFRSLY